SRLLSPFPTRRSSDLVGFAVVQRTAQVHLERCIDSIIITGDVPPVEPDLHDSDRATDGQRHRPTAPSCGCLECFAVPADTSQIIDRPLCLAKVGLLKPRRVPQPIQLLIPPARNLDRGYIRAGW